MTKAGSQAPGFRKAENVGFLVLGAALVAAVFGDEYLHVAGALVGIGACIFCAASIRRTLVLLLFLSIVFTLSNLRSAGLPFPIMRLRPDEMLAAWSVILWIILSMGEDVSTRNIGIVGRLILLFVGVLLLGTYLGARAGNDTYAISHQLRNQIGILVFFPALALLRKSEKEVHILLLVLVAAAALGSLTVSYRGVFGAGEGVFMRQTGLRVFSRQAYVVGLGLVFLLANQHSAGRSSRLPLPAALVMALLMTASILFSQMRGLWLAVMAAILFGLLLSSIKRGAGSSVLGQLLRSLVVVAVLFAVAIAAVGSVSMLGSSGIVERAESVGESLQDISLLARIIMWYGVADEIIPDSILLGKGLGYELTVFRPDRMTMRTHWWIDGSLFQAALNMGLIGCVALFAPYAVAFLLACRGFLRARDPDDSAIMLGAAAGILLLVISSFSMSLLNNYRFVPIWGILLAIPVALWPRIREEKERTATVL